MSSAQATQEPWLPRAIEWHLDFFERIAGAGWSMLDLVVRLGIAKSFVVDAVIRFVGSTEPVIWHSALALFGAVMLVPGLLTRYAALLLLMLPQVTSGDGSAPQTALFASAWLAWLVIHGAGSLSLDSLVRRGLADSALPLAGPVVAASNWVRDCLGPVFLSGLRLGLAALGVLAARSSIADPLIEGIALGLAALLMVGWLTRYVAAVSALITAVLIIRGAPHGADAYACALLLLCTLFGGGLISVDALLAWLLRHRYPEFAGTEALPAKDLPRVVIVGAGFGGLTCAQALRRVPVQVTVIDRGNYHLFQPLLYQVATAGLSPSDIAASIRSQFRDSINTSVLLGTVSGIDVDARHVQLGERQVPYDYLVVATGATHSYFGRDQWQAYAPGLKRIEDATAIRGRLLRAFERAEATEEVDERRALLTFLIVGAGPTGVELAGAIVELARYGMEKEFRRFDPAQARVILVDAGPRVLPAFDPRLSAIAQRSLSHMGVDILLNSPVSDIDALGVSIGEKTIAARTVLWAAGVKASPAAQWLHAAADNAGRVKVTADLSIPKHPEVFVVGDTALSMAWAGHPVPGLAPAAKQGGAYVARIIRARVRRRQPPGEFVYHHAGSLATIGRQSAVADFGRVKLSGLLAWWLWGVVHIGFLLGIRNRLATLVNWFWSYLTYAGGIRLITGQDTPDHGGPNGT